MTNHKQLNVGAVSYLNTKPLVFRFEEFASDANLVFDLPSRLADRLASGELDVALIPSIEAFQNSAYRVISDACIACRGPVLSVKLLSRVPMEQIGTLALDEGSRTSVALTRVLLDQRFGIRPKMTRLPIGDNCTDTETDAVLLIGDRAIHPPQDEFMAEWDLGDQWCRWSELPFVFAMWTARAGVETATLERALEAARDAGVANLDAIADEEAANVGLSSDVCRSYLRNNLHFYLRSREKSGLKLFHHHANQLGLAPAWNGIETNRETHGCETS